MKFLMTDYHSKTIEDYITNMFFYNEDFRDRFFDEIIPNIFFHSVNRYIIYVIRKLYLSKIAVNFQNLMMQSIHPDPDVDAFLRRNEITTKFSIQEISNVLINSEFSNTSQLVVTDVTITALKSLYKLAFKRFVEGHIYHIQDCLKTENFREVLTRANAINRVYDVLFNKNNINGKELDNQLIESQNMINSIDEYVPTFSAKINALIGGFTRKAITTIIGKSGHNKTTLSLFNALYAVRNGLVDKVLFISTEEDAPFYWRRIFSMVLGIKLSEMRNKNVKILDEHLETVKRVVENRIRIVTDVVKYKDVVDVLSSSDDDVIYIDHLQNIIYPGNGTFLANMIGGIPQLISFEKQIVKRNNNVIVNLSQVNDKDIQGDFSRKNKAPRYYDAYASSAMYQGSREFISIWYPIKDFDELGKEEQLSFGTSDVIVSIEKSNFTQTGKVRLKYNPDYCSFEDK